MQRFLTTLLQCSISMSLVSLVYMAMMPILTKRYAVKWQYRIWIVIAIGWILPFRPHIYLSFFSVRMPDNLLIPTQVDAQPMIGMVSQPMTAARGLSKISATIHLWDVLVAIWIVGLIIVLVYHALRHRRFVKMVSRWSKPVTDLEILRILDTLRSELKIKEQVEISVCPSIKSPMLVGFHHPIILLPLTQIGKAEYSLILCHELIHYKRHDLWYKALILTATAFHWFDPVVYLMAKVASAQCESSCDALVLVGADFHQRKKYGETIISAVRNGSKLQTTLSTNFYGGKRGMKNRISLIMDINRKKTGISILAVVLAGILMGGAVLATPIETKKKSLNGDTSEIMQNFKLTVKDCNIRVEISQVKQISIDCNSKKFDVVQSTNDFTDAISICPKSNISAGLIDMVTVTLPEKKYSTITVNGTKAGVSLPSINANLNLTNNRGAMNFMLPARFTKEINFTTTGGSASFVVNKASRDYQISMQVSNSAVSASKILPDYKSGATKYTYTNGEGNAKINLIVKNSSFTIDSIPVVTSDENTAQN